MDILFRGSEMPETVFSEQNRGTDYEWKRQDYISWDEYFMGVAILSGRRTKDPNTQVGCCIVSADNKILSMGYNGLPRGCSDDEFPWEREGEDPLKTKYVYTVHSESECNLELQWRKS